MEPERRQVWFIAYSDVPGIDTNSPEFLKAQAVVAKAAANALATAAEASARHTAFPDSGYVLAGKFSLFAGFFL